MSEVNDDDDDDDVFSSQENMTRDKTNMATSPDVSSGDTSESCGCDS